MRNLILITVILHIYSFAVYANKTSSKKHWNKTAQKEITAKEIISNLEYFNLSKSDHLILKKTMQDALGFVHYDYEQLHNNTPIENASIRLHEKNGKVELINGKTAHFFKGSDKPSINKSFALQKALSFVDAKLYAWQVPAYEETLCNMANNSKTTFYPTGKLLWYKPPNASSATPYKLNYKFDIYSIEPHSRQYIYVEATTGNITESISRIANCSAVSATAETNYYGTVNINVCSEDGHYHLKNLEDVHVEVFDSQQNHLIYQNEITDVNNHFENNKSANEVLWATQKVHNYFKSVFGRNSIDDEGMPILSWVNYANEFGNKNDSFWNGNWMLFGDGDGQNFNSLTSTDIVAHELMHGITEFSANLVYSNESGALNESFSDIFGEVIEFYAKGATDWLVGAEVVADNNKKALRSLKNPKDEDMIFQQPDTYNGLNWWTDKGDFGGVHYNSGVQNHWFYLLAEGGNGVNDNGYSYLVEPIGIDKAAAIAYRNLTYYLKPNATYEDAKNGAIQAAKDLFGTSSYEAFQTELAWRAAGIGEQDEMLNPDESTPKNVLDSLALIALYYSTNANNTWVTSWDLTKPMREWYGVEIDPSINRVQSLELYQNGLTGRIPQKIGWLSELNSLNLAENNLKGALPISFSKLNKIHYLDLSNNQLSGAIPEMRSNNLLEVKLQNNKFEGNLTSLWYNYANPNIELINIENNKLSGSLYTPASYFEKLHTLNLSHNQFNGYLSTSTSLLPALKNLYLNNNLFTGELPGDFAVIPNLEKLQLQNNLLSGCISPRFTTLCNSPVEVDISGNNFDSELIDFCSNGNGVCGPNTCRFSDSLNLMILSDYIFEPGWDKSLPIDLWPGIRLNADGCVASISIGEDTDGTMPPEIGNFSQLEILSVFESDLTGPIPPEIGQLSRLTNLDLGEANFTGPIPTQIGNLVNLTYLDLGENALEGQVPMSFKNLVNLNDLDLTGRNLNGTLNEQLSNCRNLYQLRIGGSKFTGNIEFINEMPFLQNAYLHQNNFSGDLNRITNYNIEFLDLVRNKFEGELPLKLLSNLNGIVNLTYNNFSGCYPEAAKQLCSKYNKYTISQENNFDVDWDTFCNTGNGTCNKIIPCRKADSLTLVKLHQSLSKNSREYEFWDFTKPIDTWQGVQLNENGCVNKIAFFENPIFIGSLPSEIGDLQSLESLIIYDCFLAGEIPKEIGNLQNLKELNLHLNEVTGEIPVEISKLSYLEHLVLSENNLQGEIPSKIENCYNLKELILYQNSLTGSLPKSLANLQNLSSLSVQYNQLSGCFNPFLKQLCDVEVETLGSNLAYEQNNFDSTWEEFCVNSIGKCEPNICRNADSLTLRNFYNKHIGILDWQVNKPLKEWSNKIKLNDEGCVVVLDLGNTELNSSFPTELLNLTALEKLYLNGSGLYGSIPGNINLLENLVALSLSGNQFTGIIPNTLFNLTDLELLRLSYNQLNGNIPPGLGNLQQLEHLQLSDNNLTGCYPETFNVFCDRFDRTEYMISFDYNNNLDASFEDFCNYGTGTCGCRHIDSLTLIKIHESLKGENGNDFWDFNTPVNTWNGVTLNENGCVKAIQFYELYFPGTIPPEIGDLQSLEILDLYDCFITGEIPKEIGKLANLKRINLGINELYGNIPNELMQLHNLEMLELPGNNFVGGIPSRIGNLVKLTRLDLGNTGLIGKLPASIANLSNLIYLYIDGNNLSGCFVPGMSNFCSQLNQVSRIDEGNNFDATWDDFCNAGLGTCSEIETCLYTDSLTLIDIYEEIEGLTWDITKPMNTWQGVGVEGNCVVGLEITEYGASGYLSPSIGQLSQLESLVINYTVLTGSVPPEIRNLSKLRYLDLKSNEFEGNIPKEIGALQNLEHLNLIGNYFSGALPVELGNLSKLKHFYVSSNNLTGTIPASYSNLNNLIDVSLQYNNLTGCFNESLLTWCSNVQIVQINQGNKFDITWENFCSQGPDVCALPGVWPGDMDNNGIVNCNDLLYYGLAYGNKGPAREDATVQWQAQQAQHWDNSIAGINGVYQDANGDGIIGQADVAAINNNYNKTHQIKDIYDNESPVSLQLQFESSSKYDETVELVYDLYAIYGEEIAPNIYGLAGSINFSDLPVKEITVDFSRSSLQPDEHFSYFDKSTGVLDISLTRTNKVNVKVEEPAARLIIIVGDVPTGDPYKVAINGGSFTTVTGGLNSIKSSSFYDNFKAGQGVSSNLSISLNTTNASCNVMGAALLKVVSGVAPYNIIWSDGTTGLASINAEAGAYSVYVSDAIGNTAQVEFTIYNSPPVYTQNGNLICGTTCPDYLLPNQRSKNNVFQSGKIIEANCAFVGDKSIQFKAGETITLDKGFYINPEVDFSAEIESCD